MPKAEFWENFYHSPEPPPWDLGGPSPALAELLAEKPLLSCRMLVPGCGLGHDAIAMAQAGHEVTAVDIIEKALIGAQRLAGEPLAQSMRWVCDDILDPVNLEGPFDCVLEHTCYAAIHPRDRDRYVQRLGELLAPEGRVLGVWFDFPFPEPGPPYASSKVGVIERFERLGFENEYARESEVGFQGQSVKQFTAAFRKNKTKT